MPLPLIGIAIIGALALSVILAVNARITSPLLVVLAFPLARPNIMGESYSVLAAALVFVAAILAFVDDGGRIQVGIRSNRTLRSVAFWLALAYVWLLVRAGALHVPIQPLLQSVLLTVAVVAAVTIVVADPKRRRVVAWGFVALVLTACASFAITLMLWKIRGVGAGHIADIPGTQQRFATVIYVPGTITAATANVFGFAVPRFDGLGREPGWMAMWCAFTFFLIPKLTKRRMRLARLLLLFGLFGTFSTAGFGVFLVVWSFETFLRPRPGGNWPISYMRQLVGIMVLAAAVWLAIKAPVFGLEAKSTLNPISVSDRSGATVAGWQALTSSPFFGFAGAGLQSGINLIASIAVGGLPFCLAIFATLVMPLRTHPERWLAAAPIAVLGLTLLTSQPPQDSTWVYVAAVVALAVTSLPWSQETATADDGRDDAPPRHVRGGPGQSRDAPLTSSRGVGRGHRASDHGSGLGLTNSTSGHIRYPASP